MRIYIENKQFSTYKLCQFPRQGIAPILPIFREGILNGSPEVKESAALGLGEAIRRTSADALKPSVVNITGPLIRILGDRFSFNVKIAMLDTLGLLLNKVYGKDDLNRNFRFFFSCSVSPIAYKSGQIFLMSIFSHCRHIRFTDVFISDFNTGLFCFEMHVPVYQNSFSCIPVWSDVEAIPTAATDHVHEGAQ